MFFWCAKKFFRSFWQYILPTNFFGFFCKGSQGMKMPMPSRHHQNLQRLNFRLSSEYLQNHRPWKLNSSCNTQLATTNLEENSMFFFCKTLNIKAGKAASKLKELQFFDIVISRNQNYSLWAISYFTAAPPMTLKDFCMKVSYNSLCFHFKMKAFPHFVFIRGTVDLTPLQSVLNATLIRQRFWAPQDDSNVTPHPVCHFQVVFHWLSLVANPGLSIHKRPRRAPLLPIIYFMGNCI